MTKLSLCEGLAQHMGLTDLPASEYLYHALEALAVAGVEVNKSLFTKPVSSADLTLEILKARYQQ